MKEIAIVGPTASGKSDLALRLALECNAYILSIDSLSIYKEIDIASAKPSREELESVKHFGIDVLRPDEHFSVATFIHLYKEAHTAALEAGKNLIIVGGTGFYLKSLLTGLSEIPPIDGSVREKSASMLRDPAGAHAYLNERDPEYMQNIETSDSYRIEKMLQLFLQTGMTPTQWFTANPPQPIIEEIPLFEIDVERSVLRERIALRTQKMLEGGLIDEVAGLEQKYGRSPNSMKAIGIVEVLEYLDGRVSKEEMKERITTHTAQLAKRQQTFNRGQFEKREALSVEGIYEVGKKLLCP